MAQENNTESTKIVDKGLTFTKKDYEDLVVTSWDLIHAPEFSSRALSDIQYLYGIFYNAFVGLLRAGALCSRNTGKDGMPRITVPIGTESYTCRESILRGILGKEADEIIQPYENTFSSYAASTGIEKSSGLGNVSSAGRRDRRRKKNPLEEKLDLAQKQAVDAVRAADALRDEIKAERQEKEEQAKQMQAKLSQAIDELDQTRKKCIQAEESLSDLSGIHKDTLEKLSTVQQERKDLAAECEELKAELDEAQAAVKRAENTSGMSSISTAGLDALKQQLDDSWKETQSLKEQIAASASDVVKKELGTVKEENLRLTEELSRQKALAEDCEKRYTSLRSSTAEETMELEKNLSAEKKKADRAMEILNRRADAGVGIIVMNIVLAVASAMGVVAAMQYFLM